MNFRKTNTLRLQDLISSLSQQRGDITSESKHFCFICLETKSEIILELTKTVPEWIAIKDLGPKGKLVKLISAMDSYSVKHKI